MSNIFLISDFHFYHKKIIQYSQRKPSSWNRLFADEYEMNDFIIQSYNDIVKPSDIVFNLGDFALTPFYYKLEKVFNALNGQCHLIAGNHDFYKFARKKLNMLNFKSISDHPILFNNILLSHKPILNPKYPNVHGHLHEKSMNDKRFFNVSIEALDYKPIHFEEILQKFV